MWVTLCVACSRLYLKHKPGRSFCQGELLNHQLSEAWKATFLDFPPRPPLVAFMGNKEGPSGSEGLSLLKERSGMQGPPFFNDWVLLSHRAANPDNLLSPGRNEEGAVWGKKIKKERLASGHGAGEGLL